MCTRTYSELRIFSDEMAPEDISMSLGLEPTSSFRTGDVHCQGELRREINGWFFCTESSVDSKDTEAHISAILAKLECKAEAVAALQAGGCHLDIWSVWRFDGQGGPSLSADQMLILGKLGIGVVWDIYADEEQAL